MKIAVNARARLVAAEFMKDCRPRSLCFSIVHLSLRCDSSVQDAGKKK